MATFSVLQLMMTHVFDHQVHVAGLCFDHCDVAFYFVGKSETIETTEYSVLG
ncbi:MAG: hypothetical protein ACI8R9_001770 [Paraglaciecola sp.]